MLSHQRIAQAATESESAALCIVTQTSGSTPRKAGARMLVFANGSELGRTEGTIGGGAIEHEVRRRAIEVIESLRPDHFKVGLTNELGMCCGGQMSVYVEPLRVNPPLIMLGAGHIAKSLANLASQSGFSSHVCDPRSELLQPERFAFACQLHNGYQQADLDHLPFGPDAFVVIATHCHQTDQELAERILPLQYKYLALVGSNRKAALTRKRCINKGFSAKQIEKLRCPAGIDLGAETPEEIAVSILSEMIRVRRVADPNV